jgi:hypothetical protein
MKTIFFQLRNQHQQTLLSIKKILFVVMITALLLPNSSIESTLNLTNYHSNIKVLSFLKNRVVNQLSLQTDLDDDDDGIADLVESKGIDATGDADNDGILNYKDPDFCTLNNKGVCAILDTDGDGIINQFDLDSDNDGIPDVVEAYGVDVNGDGKIDNFYDVNGDGLSDNAAVISATNGLGAPDFDGDGIPNYIDKDSDGDGIPDIIEAGGIDVNNDGAVDDNNDDDHDGLMNSVDADSNNDGIIDNQSLSLLRTGTDINGDGKTDSWPYRNADLTGGPNFLDLDSDGDGIVDAKEAGFPGVERGIVQITPLGADGWSIYIHALFILNLPNTDGRGFPNYLDIDSDDDGITDNVEAQGTSSYKIPNDIDTDGDGIADVYEVASQIGIYGGNGLTAFDKDGDGTPDYKDLDSDNDGVLDYIEGTTNLYGVANNTLNFTDTDNDGLIDQFDNIAINSLSVGSYFKNVTMGNMGSLGNFNGPTPTGSLAQLPQNSWAASNDRDWRSNTILPLHIIDLSINHTSNSINLNWYVVNELQTNNYTIEFSLNGVDFESIGKVEAKNTNTAKYSFTHNMNLYKNEILYYRIKQTENSGQSYYTPIKSIHLKNEIEIYIKTNPFVSFINFTYLSTQNQKLIVKLYSLNGELVIQKKYSINNGRNELEINNLGEISKGVYFFNVQSIFGIKTVKIIKL